MEDLLTELEIRMDDAFQALLRNFSKPGLAEPILLLLTMLRSTIMVNKPLSSNYAI